MQRKILIIEDDPTLLENIERILKYSGYKVYKAENGAAGIEKAKLKLPDLILCDILMPELDGYDVLYILGQDENTARIPFIFLTGKSDLSDMRKGMSLGADDFLVKPFDKTDLLKAIQTRLEKKEMLEGESISTDTTQGLNSIFELARIKDGKKSEADIEHVVCGEELFREGDLPRYLYLIHSGEIKTYLLHNSGKMLITNTYIKGDVLGIENVISDQPYSEYAEALKDAEIEKISKEFFLNFLFQRQNYMVLVMGKMAQNINTIKGQLLNQAYEPVKIRVISQLLKLEDKRDTTLPDENIELSISRTDLAALVGASVETIVRALSELSENGILDTSGKDIIIHDVKKLKAQINFS